MKTASPCAHVAQDIGDAPLLGAIEALGLGPSAHRARLARGRRIDLPSRFAATLVVISGRLSAETLMSDGQEAFLGDVEPGELIGEAFAFERCDTPLSVTVDEAAEVWCFQRGHFARVFEGHSCFATAVVRAMCRRQCRTIQRMAEALTLSMSQRLAAELLRLAEADAAGMTIGKLPTHRQIALRIATQREAVTKELGRMERSGAIRREARGLRLVGPDWRLWDAE